MNGPRFNTVIFDCDSTLSAVEGIEELARDRGIDLSDLTEAAMRGEVPLEAVYGRRLELVAPRRDEVAALGSRYVSRLVPDAPEVIRALQGEGIDVHIVSGGLLPAVLHLAEALGVPGSSTHAVRIDFDEGGGYAGFDPSSPLARSGGKPLLIRSLDGRVRRPAMMVGDGITDREAAAEVDEFVAYAGVVDRPEVTRGVRRVIRSPSLAPVFPIALGFQSCRPEHLALFQRGIRLLD